MENRNELIKFLISFIYSYLFRYHSGNFMTSRSKRKKNKNHSKNDLTSSSVVKLDKSNTAVI